MGSRWRSDIVININVLFSSSEWQKTGTQLDKSKASISGIDPPACIEMAYFRQFSSARGRMSYLLADLDRRDALIIDPDDDLYSLYLGVLEEMQLRLDFVLLTHVHAGVALPGTALMAATGATLAMAKDGAIEGTRVLDDGEILAFGDEVLQVWMTPGHTRNSVSFLWRDRVFSGDSLLIGDCGATDGTDADPGILYDSLTRRLLSLPDETLIYPAHDFSDRYVSCIGEQRRSNPKLKGTTRDEFIALQQRKQFSVSDGNPSVRGHN